MIALFRREMIQRALQGGIQPWLWTALLTNVLYYLFLVISIRSLGGVFACILMAALPMIFQRWLLAGKGSSKLTLPLLLLVGALLLLISQKFDQGIRTPMSTVCSVVCYGCCWRVSAGLWEPASSC